MNSSDKELEKIKKLIIFSIDTMYLMFLCMIISFVSICYIFISEIENVENKCIVQK